MRPWDIKYKPNLDWNHAWGTAPANIITRYVWGITPAKAGFSVAHIKPQLGELKFSKIKVPTIKGSINAEYKLIDRRYKLFIIKLPKGMTGDLLLPQNPNSKLFLNHRPYTSASISVPLKAGINTIEIKNE